MIFDLDGVLIDSEGAWNSAREQVTREGGGHWRTEAQRTMMGMSSLEWSSYMHEQLGVRLAPAEISAAVVERLQALYRRHLPLLPGAREVVAALAGHWALGLASSANRSLIELVLELAGLAPYFSATVSSEEVAHGKPAPDVYLRAAEVLGIPARRGAAVEDSSNGLRSAAAARMRVIAVPNRQFPPSADALALADLVLTSLTALTPARVAELGRGE